MLTPGAAKSGLRRPSDVGPRLEKPARKSSESVVLPLSPNAPIVIT